MAEQSGTVPDPPDGYDVYDSGEVETLPDGAISVPIIEEELVITKRLVVKERIIIRKGTVVENRRVEAHLRKERLVVESEGSSDQDGK